MSHRTPAPRRARAAALLAGLTATGLLVTGATSAGASTPAATAAAGPAQPEISTRSAPLLDVDGLRFRDLDRDGALTPYEDWRRTPDERATDLLARMDLAQRAGLLVHASLGNDGASYDLRQALALIGDSHVRYGISRLSAPPAELATANDTLQQIAEQEPLGIPVVISTDPRNGFTVTEGQTVSAAGLTALPAPTGMAATGDAGLTRRLGDLVRAEYRAVGISMALSPQADLATEPRWTRINGTFGSDPETVRDHVRAYVEGFQGGAGGASGLGPDSVATVTKHWAGYGAQVNGYDSHYYYGRYAAFPGGAFEDHLLPYDGAFAAGTAGIMPTYSILQDLQRDGRDVEQVGAGFNSYLLQDVLRGEKGFDGVVLSDWGITGDCPQECRDNRPPNRFIGPWGVGMPWGLEDASETERYAATLDAGVDQVGGSSEPEQVVAAVEAGLLSQDRVDEAAHRVLVQTFQLGLFENPYVDPAEAAQVAGSAASKEVGDAAQATSLTLLQNRSNLLPLRTEQVRTVHLVGIDAEQARAQGFEVVDDPAAADLTIARIADPRGGDDLTGLTPPEDDPAVVALRTAHDAGRRTVAVPTLDRPLVLTGVLPLSDAVLANYGVSDEVLLEVLRGERDPRGRLPFELPSSEEAVAAQLPDVPDDSADPLFDRGAGQDYRRSPVRVAG